MCMECPDCQARAQSCRVAIRYFLACPAVQEWTVVGKWGIGALAEKESTVLLEVSLTLRKDLASPAQQSC